MSLYPFFEECMGYTLDPYWKDILLRCANNKFPKGVRYDSKTQTLTIRTINSIGPRGKNALETLEVPKSPSNACSSIINAFKEKLEILSPVDMRIKREEIDMLKENRKINLHCQWGSLRPKYVKDHLIMDYVNRKADEDGLSMHDSRNLYNAISLGIQLKSITSEHIHYSNGFIEKIDGISYDDKKQRWSFPLPTIVSRTEKTSNVDYFYRWLDRFLKSYCNRKLLLN